MLGPKWKIGFTTFSGFINRDVAYHDDMAIIDWKDSRFGEEELKKHVRR